MKNIAMVVHACYLRDARVRRYAEGLADLGYRVDVFCIRDGNEKNYESVRGVKIYRIPVYRFRGGMPSYIFEYLVAIFLFGIYLTKHHLTKRYDIVHVHNMPDILVISALFTKITGCKIILDLHDPMPEQFISMFGDKDHKPVFKAFLRMLALGETISFALSDRLITVEQSFKDIFMSRHSNIDLKMVIVRNVIDEKIFGNGINDISHSRNKRRINMLYVGTLSYRYLIHNILDALAIVRKITPDIHFSIYGKLENEGDYTKFLRCKADQLKLNDVVSFHSPVPLDQIPSIMRDHSIGISIGKHDCYMDYVLPLKIMEFASQEMAIIATRQPTLTKYFSDDQIRFVDSESIEDLASAISELAADRSLRESLGKNVKKVVSQYPWSLELKKYLDIADKLMRP